MDVAPAATRARTPQAQRPYLFPFFRHAGDLNTKGRRVVATSATSATSATWANSDFGVRSAEWEVWGAAECRRLKAE